MRSPWVLIAVLSALLVAMPGTARAEDPPAAPANGASSTPSEAAPFEPFDLRVGPAEAERPGWGTIAVESWKKGAHEGAEATPAVSAGDYAAVAPVRRPIALGEAVAIALARNPSIAVSRIEPQIAESAIGGREGLFDFRLFADVNYTEDKQQTSSTILGEITKTYTHDVGVRRAIETGGNVELKLSQTRTETDSPVTSLNPQYRTRLDLSATQSLLKGAGLETNRLRIEIARTDHKISQEAFAEQVSQIIGQVVNAYYALQAAYKGLDVAHESLALARKLQHDNEIQVEVGTLAPIEVLQAKTAVARREEEVIVAEQRLDDAQDTLRTLLGLREHAGFTFVPTTDPLVDVRKIALDVEIEKAFENRHDYRQARLALERENKNLKLGENELLPKLDLVANLGLNGLAGRPQNVAGFGPTSLSGDITLDTTPIGIPGDTTFPFDLAVTPATTTTNNKLKGDLFDSFGEMIKGEGHTWGVGLAFEMPLENRAAEAAHVAAKLAARRARLSLLQLENQIVFEVREAVRQIETNLKRIKTTEAATRLAEEQLDAEEKKLEVGLSTNFQVLDFQQQLSASRLSGINARTEYARGLVNLYVRTGTMLDRAHVTVTP